MYCMRCGQQLPDDANFCLNCGLAQRPDAVTAMHVAEPRWETCEIRWQKGRDHFWGGPEGRFWADAIGKDGRYTATRSESVRAALGPVTIGGNQHYVPLQDAAEEHLDAFITRLVRDGWESTGSRGDFWFSLRFRRRSA